MEETNENKNEVTKMTEEEADKNRLLLGEDIQKYELAKARAKIQIAQYDAAIAECMLALSDIDRRVAGVEYPEPPKPAKTDAPAMGEPIGGKETK